LAVEGANTHDIRLVEKTLKSIPIKRPKPSPRKKQHICLDKGYDSDDLRKYLRKKRYQPHAQKRGKTNSTAKHSKRKKARRWVVERTHSWLNRFRRILIRWEKKVANYEAMLHLAFAYITLKAAWVFG